MGKNGEGRGIEEENSAVSVSSPTSCREESSNVFLPSHLLFRENRRRRHWRAKEGKKKATNGRYFFLAETVFPAGIWSVLDRHLLPSFRADRKIFPPRPILSRGVKVTGRLSLTTWRRRGRGEYFRLLLFFPGQDVVLRPRPLCVSPMGALEDG